MTAYNAMARIIMDAVAESFPAKQRDEIRSFWDPRPVVDALLAAKQTQPCPLDTDGDGDCHACAHGRNGGRPDCSSGVVEGTEPLALLAPIRVRRLDITDADDGSLRSGEPTVPVYRRAGSPDE